MTEENDRIKSLNKKYYSDQQFRNIVDSMTIMMIEGIDAIKLQEAIELAFEDATKRWNRLSAECKKIDKRTQFEKDLIPEMEEHILNKIDTVQPQPDLCDRYYDSKTGITFIYSKNKKWEIYYEE